MTGVSPTCSSEVVLVFRCELDHPDDLERVVSEMGKVDGVTSTWGWAGISTAARAVLAVVDAGDVDPTVDSLAKLFHDTYEALAPEFSYATRPESAVPWEDVADNNKALMRAVVARVLGVSGG